MNEVYAELKSWQTGIGAFVGFLALMSGALFNFHLNRRRDAIVRQEEATSVAAAIYGEIVLLRNELARLARVVASVYLREGLDHSIKFDCHFVEAYSLSEPYLYKALAPKFGILDAAIVVAVTEFHKSYQEARASLPLLVKKEDQGYGYSPLAILVPARNAVRNITPTLRTIEKLAHVEKAAGEPDFGSADLVIEMEEDLFNTPTS
jgi:hypothetical protein